MGNNHTPRVYETSTGELLGAYLDSRPGGDVQEMRILYIKPDGTLGLADHTEVSIGLPGFAEPF
jgi:hypothetical protein